eukprot:TRINITY_DN86_c0_g1_i1.p1 TRINITY_DN86_c0_g1~~TRINITY_DN86_c0_g1_i1.p1  ORF type:complete len:354 (+),score=118.47 TRINITY_DN86_c0_g1_i1:57-1118(+)
MGFSRTDSRDAAERREALDESLPGNEPWRAVVYGFEDEGAAVMMDFTSAPSDYVRPEPRRKYAAGSFSDRIELLQCKATDQQFVAKVIRNAEGKKRDSMMHERTMLRKLADVPNVARLRHSMETQEELFLVLEKFDCDLFDFSLEHGKVSEDTARLLTWQLLTAVKEMHARGVAHRDVKPENVLLTVGHTGSPQRAALTDMGMAMQFDVDNPKDSGVALCGGSTAPELVHRLLDPRKSRMRRGFRAVTAPDLWGIGMALHSLLTGSRLVHTNPRTERDWRAVLTASTRPIRASSQVYQKLSAPALDLLSRLLQPLPHNRLTAEEALKHEWLAGLSVPDSPMTAAGARFPAFTP